MRRSVKIRAFFCLFALLPLQNSGASLRECPGARWISTAEEGADCPNSWIAFRRDVELKALPAVAPVCIAADTKYWLWINGECVVFEGGLKRGPTPAVRITTGGHRPFPAQGDEPDRGIAVAFRERRLLP